VQRLIRLIQSLSPDNLYLLRSEDKHGVQLIHYFCALNLHEVISLVSKLGVDMQAKVRGRSWTPLLIAASYDFKESI
jgi:hypothetical protein